MDTRREFLKKAALLSGSAALVSMLPPVIERALAINPALGSTFYDAEHIVFLMQENRSFDHQFGMLQGVRGYNDPRAVQLPDKNKVWLQTDKDGDVYAPFHLDVKDTKIAWMGSLPHGWSDQSDARNDGKYDRWLEVKKANNKAYAPMPRTLGYCDRSDFPFYYSLADAFTVCDQSFCSSLTGTHPNRYYWMTGTVRETNNPEAKAHLWNITNNDQPELQWKTFPERLEEEGISWKIYQNEVSMGTALNGESENWLGNFGTNVMEYFRQYNIRLYPGAAAALQTKKENILQQINTLEKLTPSDASDQKLTAAKKLLAKIEADIKKYSSDVYDGLSRQEKSINGKAFSTNQGDPYYHELTSLTYGEGDAARELNIPKGDILHQFRKDVKAGTLPTVSWMMAPGNFSDHPGEPWFGPWYVSEVMEILLENPEVWKKTIFILTYDENDGYFDHVPPFVVPDPYKDHAGKVSQGIDPKMDFVTKDQQTNPSASADRIRESAIGLGYRIPMIIASPWTRGGYVCSELFDHTSSLQFLEKFIAGKFNKKIKEENITAWRRSICGDLASAFRPYNGEKIDTPKFLDKVAFIEGIHQAKFREAPANFKKLSADEIALINTNPLQSPHFPKQEKGIRAACALPYELYADGAFDRQKNAFQISFRAGDKVFGEKSAGSPFYVYAINPYKEENLRTWHYAVTAGNKLDDEWMLDDFENKSYHLRVYGPNGFYREFSGTKDNPAVRVSCHYENEGGKLNGNVVVNVVNQDAASHEISVTDLGYKEKPVVKSVAGGSSATFLFAASRHFNWYDFSVRVKGFGFFEERFAGRVETGLVTKTDPLMGGVV